MLFSLGGGSGATSIKSDALQSMSADELWSLHERVVSVMARKILEEEAELEERLHRLENRAGAVSPGDSTASSDRPRRPYPKVLAKYRNPRNPAERWSGRGKQPRWVRAQLKAGRKLEQLRIA